MIIKLQVKNQIFAVGIFINNVTFHVLCVVPNEHQVFKCRANIKIERIAFYYAMGPNIR